MSGIYMEFGLGNGAVIAGDSEEHVEEMLSLPTGVRDGDDTFEVVDADQEVDGPEDADDGQDEQDDQQDDQQDQGADDEGGQDGDEGGDEQPASAEAELAAVSSQVEEYTQGFAVLQAQAVKMGLPQEVADRITQEFSAEGDLSEESYKALQEVGFTRAFIASYVTAQEALAESYVTAVANTVGGREQLGVLMNYMESVGTLEPFMEALESRDLKAVQSTLKLIQLAREARYGKTPRTDVTRNKAPAVRPAAKAAEGYASRDAMVKAMSDRRYATDPAYRAEVEKRVGASNF